jgi:DNA-binding NarL/FixJ family response regulator
MERLFRASRGIPEPTGNRSMAPQKSTCAILADRHTVLAERVRDLLEADFQTVYLVADAPSLREGAQRLAPALIVLDLSLESSDCPRLLREIAELSPTPRVIVLSVHDEATVARMALASGVQGVVLKRTIGSDFLCAVSAVLRGERYVSPDFGLAGFAP